MRRIGKQQQQQQAPPSRINAKNFKKKTKQNKRPTLSV